MRYYAQIDAERRAYGVTQTTAPVEQADMIALVTYDLSVIGKTHDADSGQWIAPPADAGAAMPRRISVLALRRRFTLAERGAIEWAAADRPDRTLAERQQAALLRAVLADQAAASYIDLTDDATAQGIQQMVAAGLLTMARAASILSAPIEPGERP